MNNPLGISVSAVNRALIPEYAAAGFSVVEISPKAAPFEELRAFCEGTAEEIAKSGMGLWSLHLPFGRQLDISAPEEEKRAAALEALFPVVELARSLGAKTLVVHGSSEPNEDAERPARMEACASSLDELNRAAGELNLALENLPRTCIGRVAEEVVSLSGHCAGICFDVNHLLMESHEEFLRAAASRVITTHLSDYDGVDERHWLPGRGIVPYKLVRDTLLRAGYTGPFLFELGAPEGRPYPPAEVISAWERLTLADGKE